MSLGNGAIPTRRKRPSQLVRAARLESAPLAIVTEVFSPISNHPPPILTHSRGPLLSKSDVEWMYTSLKTELQNLYVASTMRWNSAEKRLQMVHEHQQILFLNDHIGRLAFLTFRYDVQQHTPIMYVYELFVESRGRRQGIAAKLMRVAEQMARYSQMTKLMLTVFVANQPAMSLYREKLGYDIDETSPSNFVSEGDAAPTYEILSMPLCV